MVIVVGFVPETGQADVVDELLEPDAKAPNTTIHLEASGQGLKQHLDHQTTTITAWRPRRKTYRGVVMYLATLSIDRRRINGDLRMIRYQQGT